MAKYRTVNHDKPTMKVEMMDRITCFVAELLGVGLVTFAGCGCTLKWDNEGPSHFQICMGFAMVVFFSIQCFAHISGAHINPAVTVSAFLQEKIDAVTAAYYIVAQCLGGFMGFGLLKLVTPSEIFSDRQCSTLVNPAVSPIQGLMVEFFATSILILVFCAIIDPRNATNTDTIPLRFGFVVFALALFSGPFTGGSFNPARTLGPAIWNNDWENHWVYWVGPLGAGILPTLAYKTIFARPEEESNATEEIALSNNDDKHPA